MLLPADFARVIHVKDDRDPEWFCLDAKKLVILFCELPWPLPCNPAAETDLNPLICYADWR